MDNYFFSVVVPTHNRSSLLEPLLEFVVAAKAAFSGQVEVIIVDSSEGSEAKKIQTLCDDYSAHYIKSTNKVTRKRNLGVEKARGEFIFFTDSDCELTKDVFTEHLRTYEQFGRGTVGVLGLTKVIGDTAPVWQTLHLDSSFTAAFSFARLMDQAPWGTCTNLSFPKKLFENIGGFDEGWELPVYGEDVDLGLRFNEAGFHIQCNPLAIVNHNSSSINSVWQVIRKKFLTGRADFYLGKKHPDRLALEYPGWVSVGLFLLPIAILKSSIVGNFAFTLLAVVVLLLGILFQALLTLIALKAEYKYLLRLVLVIIFEAMFEAGKHVQSLAKGKFKRLWTKFIYSEKQLLGERNKRIRQVWSIVFVFFTYILLSSFIS